VKQSKQRMIVVFWGQDDGGFFSEEGLPRNPSQGTWKGGRGLYVAGLGRKGILGATFDAKNIAEDISRAYIAAELESHNRVVVSAQQSR
jgi:indole-3-pyruvate monooxygenase